METLKSNLIIPNHMITAADYRRLGLQVDSDNPEALFEGPFAVSGGDGSGAPASGYNEAGDIFDATIDGVRLADIWSEFQETLQAHNSYRNDMIRMLTYPVTNMVESWWPAGIPDTVEFEEATEYGEPVGIRTPELRLRGYPMRYYDLAIRYTWRYLAEATADQVRALNNSALEKDLRLQYQTILQALFLNTNGSVLMGNVVGATGAVATGATLPVFRLWNADGEIPPRWKTYVHDGDHTHYLVNGAAAVRPVDLEAMEDHLIHHGYRQVGRQFVLLVNRSQSKTIQGFRLGTASAAYDFIPVATMAQRGTLIGGQPAGQWDAGWIGSYGHFMIKEEDVMPIGYMLAFTSDSAEGPANLVGVREHPNAAVRGLKLLGGNRDAYPLIGSFYHHAMGAGVGDRSGGVVMQIKASGDYEPPTFL